MVLTNSEIAAVVLRAPRLRSARVPQHPTNLTEDVDTVDPTPREDDDLDTPQEQPTASDQNESHRELAEAVG